MKEDPRKAKGGVSIPYHQSTLCPDVHFRVSPISKNVKKSSIYVEKSRKKSENQGKKLGAGKFSDIHFSVSFISKKK